MRIHAPIMAAVALTALCSIAQADDHLFNAQQHGLRSGGNAINQSHAFTTNKAGHSGDLAAGQGSPFTGEERQTPSSLVGASKPHANIKPRSR